MKTVIYTTTTCPYCKMLKDYLKEHNVEYEEKLVDQDAEARDEMMEKTEGYLGVPYTIITKEDGNTLSVLGFDKRKINEIFGIN